VWAPFNLKNILLQNEFIKNKKPKAQIQNHQNPIPYKNKWGIILHKKRPIPLKDINN
jgi:hypothetical protein